MNKPSQLLNSEENGRRIVRELGLNQKIKKHSGYYQFEEILEIFKSARKNPKQSIYKDLDFIRNRIKPVLRKKGGVSFQIIIDKLWLCPAKGMAEVDAMRFARESYFNSPNRSKRYLKYQIYEKLWSAYQNVRRIASTLLETDEVGDDEIQWLFEDRSFPDVRLSIVKGSFYTDKTNTLNQFLIT